MLNQGPTHPLRAALAPAVPRVGWKAMGALTLLFSGVALAAMPRAADGAASSRHQWRALGIAPAAAGGRTGIQMMPTHAVEPIESAPDRARVELVMTMGAADSLQGLLARAGASPGEAGAAAALIAGAAPAIPAGTRIAVVLGARNNGGRVIDSVELRSGLDSSLQLVRSGEGLRLIKRSLAVDSRPVRVRGRVGEGLYWSLRASGVSPQSAAQYLQALATQIDVGSEVGPDDRFDLIIASRRVATGEQRLGQLLYAGIDRASDRDLQLLKWGSGGRSAWVDAANLAQPSTSTMAWPVAGRITSGFGYRIHPILRFARLHKGVDFGASWGSPIVAAADGQVTKAGWAGGYGRQVRIAHSDGIATSYSHMSSMTVEPGSLVRRGQLIGYVGSSGLSTGPHLHYEVYRGGRAVNPLSVRLAGASVDLTQVNAIKARLKALLSVGGKQG